MGRGRRGLLDDLTVLPWPVGLSVGVLGFGLIRYGIPAWASSQPGPLAQALGRTDALVPLAWIVLAACAMASLFSGLDSRGSPPFSRTLTIRPIEALRSVHVEA